MDVSYDEIEKRITISHGPTYDTLILSNSILPLIAVSADDTVTLLFWYSYLSDDWIFIDHVVFNVDGEVYRIEPDSLDRDVLESGRVLESGTIILDDDLNQELLDDLLNGEDVLVRFDGSDGNYDYSMTVLERVAFRKIHHIYRNLIEGTLTPTLEQP
jgi:hypothetical protein